MGFSLKGAITGALTGGASGGWAGAGIGAAAGGFLGGSDDMSAMDIYKMQRADALSDWNRQNAYNDPVSQMQRLIKANLNPYLVYQSGNVTGNSSSGIDQVSYKPQTVDNLSSTLTKALQNLNYRSLKADTKGKEIDTEMRELDLALKKAKIAQLATGRKGNHQLLPIEKQRANVAAMTTAERRDYWNNLRNEKDWKSTQRKYMLQYYQDRESRNAYDNSFIGRALKFAGSVI